MIGRVNRPDQGQNRRDTAADQEGHRPVEQVDQGSKNRKGTGDADGGGALHQTVGPGPLPAGNPRGDGPARCRIDRGAEDAHEKTHGEQGGQHQTGGHQGGKAGQTGQRSEQARAEAHHHQGQPWTEPVDEPPARRHAHHVSEQERRIHRADLLLTDAGLVLDGFVVSDRHADPVEPGHETERHQQGHDLPAHPRGRAVVFQVRILVGGVHAGFGGGWNNSMRIPLGSRR